MDLFAAVDEAARRHGVDPELARRVLRQESGGRTGLVSPKGARGPMQLMPGTARDLGVNPDDPLQNIDGGVRYLKQQLNSFGGDHELALAAYNAGPGNVRKYGGVPPFRETQNYVRGGGKVDEGFDGASIFGTGSSAPARGGDGGSADFDGSSIFATPQVAPKPPPARAGVVQQPQRPPQVQARAPGNPTIAQDAASGFAQPFRDLAGTVMAGIRKPIPTTYPKNVGEFFSGAARNVGDAAGLVGGMLNLGSAPVQAVVRPVARAVRRTIGDPTEAPQLSFNGGRPTLSAPRKLQGDEAQARIEGDINTALAAARPATVRAPAAPRLPVKDPEQLVEALQADKAAKYAKVKALGGAYDGQSAVQLRQTMTADVLGEGLDEAAHPGAFSVLKRADKVLSGAQPVTLDELDKLRQVAWRNAAGLKGPDKEAERFFGNSIIQHIDDFIANAKPAQTIGGNPAELDAAITEARAANQRFRKTQLVANRIDSGELRAATTYAGGNKANAVRQNLRPLVDKSSPQKMRGLSKVEERAVRQVAMGTPAANAFRTVGKLSDPRGLIGMGFQAALQTVAGAPSGGLSGLAIPLGAASSEASNAATMSATKKLLDLFANGPRPGLASAPSLAGPYAPLSGPTRLLGAAEVLHPLARKREAASEMPRPGKRTEKDRRR